MAQAAESGVVSRARASGGRDRAMAAGVIGAHTVEHIYSRGFIVLLPHITATLGLSPIFAGLIDASRQISSGLIALSSGILVDMYHHRRGQMLAIAMLVIGLGYFLASVVGSAFALVVVAVMLGSAGSGLWHPPALGMLAERFPERKGLVVSLHRSTGSLGDFIGPVIVGALLVTISWQLILRYGLVLILPLFLAIAVFLRRTGSPTAAGENFWRRLTGQFRITGRSFSGTGMISVMLVSAIRGMGDRALILYLPFYMEENLGMGDVAVGFHVGLLAAMGIVVGPILGFVSDRARRKPLIVGIMLVSTILPITMVWPGSQLGLTVSVVVFGIFFFSVNSLTQVMAIDLTEGRGLEGTAIGVMWGNNALFGAASPVIAGGLAEIWGFSAAFYYAAALFFLGFLISLAMPSFKPRRAFGAGR
ncbi:MAG: MFS transporter [Dehalococcoidia bacterium]|nr:MFS transporter [Dehalococcoidia bacterium]